MGAGPSFPYTPNGMCIYIYIFSDTSCIKWFPFVSGLLIKLSSDA